MARSRRGRRSQRGERGRTPGGTMPAAVTVDAGLGGATALPAPFASPTADLAAGARDLAARLFVPLAVVVLAVAAGLRLPELAATPFHHDEGVNGYFTTNLVRNGVYVYDPANYHGPSLYYFALVSEILFGLTTEAMRLVPVAFGLLTVAFVPALRPLLGAAPTLAAAALLAVSPGAVYISRYFIHEALLVCFSLAIVVAALRYGESRRPVFVLAGALAAALLFATKETGIITVVVLVIAWIASRIYVGLRHPAAGGPARAGTGRRAAPPRTIHVDGVEYREVGRTGERVTGTAALPTPEVLTGAAIVFLVVYVLLFSSFFTNFPGGLIDSLATFMIWTQTGGETQVQPFHAYLVWMAQAELPILALGTIGGLIAAVRGRDRLWVFVGLWALGITLAYSLVSYKTPWIALNMVLPLALLAGHALHQGWSSRFRPLVPVALGAGLLLSGYQAIDLSYRHYDDETYPYVFVHTTRDTLALVDEIEATAARTGSGRDTGIVIVSPDYWPLPWYLRDYPRAGFYGQIVDTEEAIIVANEGQRDELASRFGERYRPVGTYTLRPGVILELYVRADLAGA